MSDDRTAPTITDAEPAGGGEHPFRYSARFADAIETRWQKAWEEHHAFRVPNPGDEGFDAGRPKFFCLDMFPYPSGAGLHVGHPEGYTATDIVCRYKRLRGFNVLHPMGFDAFGLPAEQYAIQTGVHPAVTTREAIENFRRQLQRFGFFYDWSREFATIDEDYYGWTQWIWLRAYDAWFDPERDAARPISELIEEFASGARPARPNPAATETGANRDAEPRDWSGLDERERARIVDTYRLAYLGEQTVNWCPKLGTALANEEVIDGRSERGGHPVYRKPLRQWMFRITAYAQRLLDDLAQLDWPDSTRTMQTEWIGRSEGAEVDFPLVNGAAPIRIYTTRPDTIFGATYMVLAPEHPLIEEIIANPAIESNDEAVRAYVEAARHRGDVERMAESREKTGVFTGAVAINPANGAEIPVWIADYVLMGYGHGAIMAVPGQDERDWAFAKTFDLPIVRTVQPPADFPDEPYVGDGPAINSAFLDGLHIADAKKAIIDWLEQERLGARKVNFKLRDWLFSRQRYWGEPFPVVFDEAGRAHPVDAAHLPVRLPEMADYQPIESDDPLPLLAKATDWVQTTAGAAGVSALPPSTPVRRETNTMPGWAGSCWYYLRFCDPRNAERFVSRAADAYWMAPAPGDDLGGVDLYVGGAEHAVLHLLYARFWHKILFDLGEVTTAEPFRKLFHQGLITSMAFQRADKTLAPADCAIEFERLEGGRVRITDAHRDVASEVSLDAVDDAVRAALPEVGSRAEFERADTDGDGHAVIGAPLTRVIAKMSKSLKNVVNPDDVIHEYGADTFRLYEMYMGPLEASKPWNTRDIAGPFRFLQRVWRLVVNEDTGALVLAEAADEAVERQLHRTIAKVGDDIERMSFNTAIAAMIEFVNEANKSAGITADQLTRFATILSPFAPHLGEELWSKLGGAGFLMDQSWPTFDPALLRDDEIELPVQIMGKVRAKIRVPADVDAKTAEALALADPRVAELLEGKTVRKVIVVPGQIVNIVAN